MDVQYLITEANISKGCNRGMNQLIHAKTEQDFINCYFDNIDFCLSKDFPENDYIKKIQNPLQSAGVFVDCKRVLKNPDRLVLLGKCDFEVEFTDFAVSRVYVKHESMLIIKASGNSFVVVDALNNSNVHVTCRDKARVVVNLYSKANCTGATKIIAKNAETYDLQTE